MALFLGEYAIDLFAGQPVKSDEETVLESLTATPTTSTQTFLPSIDIDGWNRVTVNPIPSQYIVPSGSTNITQNGTFDVGQYASAIVNVPGIVPSGTLNITSNNTYDVTQYASAEVNVPVGQTINNQNKSVTPTQLEQSITADSGYTGLGTVTVEAIESTYIGSGVTQRSSTDLTASGATVTVPAGYYASQASKTVSSGSAGTPSASKGTVTNHSISITPSVTNTTGYITGGTKTGTAVTVSANQLVSGTLNISSNGTQNVTNYASVSVNVPTGSTINNQDKNVTPSESQQSITADSGYTGLGTVTVGAIDDTYIGSAIDRNDSNDLTVSGNEVTAPAGYYAAAASASIATGTATTPTSSITANPSISVNSSGLITATASGSKSITPTISAGYITTGTAGVVSVSGSNTQQLSTQAATTITPSETSQTAVASGKYTTGAITVAAIPSTYIGSDIDRRDSDDLTSSGATVTVPAGYYSESASKSISSGSVTAPSSISGTTATVSTGTNTLTLTKSVSVTPNVTTAGYISSGTAGNSSVSLTANVTTKAAATITPGTSNQTISSGTYLTGTQTIAGDTDLVAGNIKTGTSIFNVTGTFTSDATAAASDIISGQTAYVNGNKITGTLSVVTYYTGSSAPSSSTGSNGDIYLKVVS